MHTQQTAYENKQLTEQESALVCALLYFDMFDHPLTVQELVECSRMYLSEKDAELTLNNLVKQQMIFKLGSFYGAKKSITMVEKRIKGNILADVYMKRAQLVSRIISRFPFVRGVIISGSLSKHYMDRGSDIDFFIVTEKGRLWICRSLLALWRKAMVGPLRKYFCINYFVSMDALKIPDENLFTATELVFMYPIYGKDVYYRMLDENNWLKKYYPNKPARNNIISNGSYPFSLKRLIEWMLKDSLGERLDTALFRFMLNRWKKRYLDEFDETQFDLNIRTKKNVSKQHEKGYQFVLLQKYKQQINTFEQQHAVTLFHG